MNNTILGPRKVVTPDLIRDVKKIFCPDKETTEIEQVIASLSNEKKYKLGKITERVEFIYHLLSFHSELVKNKKSDIIIKHIEDETIIIKHNTIILFNKEFNGVDYDIEALSLYLLLTCVDTIAGQDDYKPFSEWISTNWENFKNDKIDLDWIKRKEKCHKEVYGIGNNFKKMLTENISDDLKKRAISNFAVTKLDDGMLNKESWDTWKNATDDDKMKKLAKNLFEQVRNKYTHTSHRTFVPIIPIALLKKTGNPVIVSLVSIEEDNLIKILMDIVKFITIKYFFKY